MADKLYLAVILESGGIYCEFNTEDFKKFLIEEFNNTKNIEKAFEMTKNRLKQVTLRI